MDPTALKSLRILFAAFASGPWLAFVTLFVIRTTEEVPRASPATDMPIVTAVALFATAFGAFASRVVVNFVVQQSAKAKPQPRAFGVLAKTQIIGQALCEFGPLAGAIAWLLDGNPLAFVTPIVGTIAMIRFWPSEQRLSRIQRQFDGLA